MKRRAVLRGLTAAALVATPAMRAAALVREFGVPSHVVYTMTWSMNFEVREIAPEGIEVRGLLMDYTPVSGSNVCRGWTAVTERRNDTN